MAKYGTENLNREALFTSIEKLTTAKKLWVAYSGGLDSHVLLDLLVNTAELKSESRNNLAKYEIGAVHVHHGLSVNADNWVKHCEKICASYQIPFKVLYVDAEIKEGKSPEEIARMARHNAWKQFLQTDEAILLAHHESDQAETLLLRLLRGAGPLGLAGMSMKTTLGQHDLLRPLLNTAKEDIQQYAKSHQLQWIEDESNQNDRFDRNYLRMEILPLLQQRWPSALKSMGRSASLCSDAAALIYNTALADLNYIKNPDSSALSVKSLLNLEMSRRRSVIRLWLQSQGFRLPSRDHMQRIDREILRAQNGAKPSLKIGDYCIKRVKGELMVISLREGELEPLIKPLLSAV